MNGTVTSSWRRVEVRFRWVNGIRASIYGRGAQWLQILLNRGGDKPAKSMHLKSVRRRHAFRLHPICLVMSVWCAASCASNAADISGAELLQIQVIPAISSNQILPNTYPLPNYGWQEISITACRGEYEPASFVLRASHHNVDEIEIKSSDLVDLLSKKTIPKAAIDISVVKAWFQGSSAWTDIRKAAPDDFRQVMVPELLLRDDALVRVDAKGHRNFVKSLVDGGFQYVHVNADRISPRHSVLGSIDPLVANDADSLQPFSLIAGNSKQVWVIAHVPEDSQPGDYRGVLKISSRGNPLREVKVRVKVLPFHLAEPRISYSIYYRAQLRSGRPDLNGGSEYRAAGQMAADIQDMRDHGVSNPTMYQSSRDLDGVEKALRLRKGATSSGDNVPLFYLGIQTTESYFGSTERSSRKVLNELFPKVSGMARQSGFGSTYIYGRDEAAGAQLEAQRRLWSLVHQAGGRVFVAGSTGAFPLVGDLLDLFVHYGKPNANEAMQWHSQGKMIFNYANPQSGPENPYLFRLNYGVMLWAQSYDGAMPYAYQHCFGSCWNDVDDEMYRDHMLTYPTVNGVISTLAWEGLREAVDDIRYISTLESMLDDIRDTSRKDKIRASTVLDDLRINLRKAQAAAGLYNHDADVDLDLIRATIQSHIAEILENNSK